MNHSKNVGKQDWENVDWSQSNIAIARVLECNPKTVARWRAKLGKPRFQIMTPEHKRKMTEGRKIAKESGRYDDAIASKSQNMTGVKHGRGQAISESHLTYGEDHHSASSHRLVTPDGLTVVFTNAEFFVRENSDLFEADDVLSRKKPNGKSYCRAANKLQAVSAGFKKSWKGWTKA